jgi:hypothetical protein
LTLVGVSSRKPESDPWFKGFPFSRKRYWAFEKWGEKEVDTARMAKYLKTDLTTRQQLNLGVFLGN